MVQNYHSEKETQVLEVVKKNPLYSVDKLHEVLPLISRNSIQRILEKNDLSKVEKRLNFANGGLVSPVIASKELIIPQQSETHHLKIPPLRQIKITALKKIPLVLYNNSKFLINRSHNYLKIVSIIIVLVSVVAISRIILAKNPHIELSQPQTGVVIEGQKLYVIGKVIPEVSNVTVNGTKVALNGDGGFTVVVNVPLGESTIEIKANYFGKKAQMIRLVNRVATKEELEAQKAEEEKKRREKLDQLAEVDRKVNDILAAKNAGGVQGVLKVMESHLKEDEGFTNVEGSLFNIGTDPVTTILVTVKFLDKNGTAIDSKFGYATNVKEQLEPGKQANFITQATDKQFSRYTIDISWEKGIVAGAVTEIQTTPQASPSSTIVPSPTKVAPVKK